MSVSTLGLIIAQTREALASHDTERAGLAASLAAMDEQRPRLVTALEVLTGATGDAVAAIADPAPTVNIPPSPPYEPPAIDIPVTWRPGAREAIADQVAARLAADRALPPGNDRRVVVARVAIDAHTDGRDMIIAVRDHFGWKRTTAAQAVSEARVAGHPIPHIRQQGQRPTGFQTVAAEAKASSTATTAPAGPEQVPTPAVVPTHREIAEVANAAIAAGDDPVSAIIYRWERPLDKALTWLQSCRERGMINQPGAFTTDDAHTALEQAADAAG